MFFKNAEIKKTNVLDGLERKVLAADGTMMLVEMEFKAGTAAPIHKHPHEQVTYVVSGSIQMAIGDEVKVLGIGDSAYIGPDIMHGVTAVEDSKVLDIFTPQREDFK